MYPWYRNSNKTIKEFCLRRNYNMELFINILAATSPLCTVKENINRTIRTMEYLEKNNNIDNIPFKYGIAHKTIFNNVKNAIENNNISGPKINPFAKALLGDEDQVVIDSWITKLFIYDVRHNIRKHKSPTKWEIIYITKLIKKLALQCEISPCAAQAALWAYAKDISNTNYKEDYDFSHYLINSLYWWC